MKKIIFIITLLPFLCFTQLTEDQIKSLEIHNYARKQVGSPPLVWSEKLEKQALLYAKILARKDNKQNMKHSQTNDGENMTYSYSAEIIDGVVTPTFSSTPLTDASVGWYEEIKDYRYSKIKKIRIGPPVGHYTQMVWKNTKKVGIAYAVSKKGSVYVVARYFPAGNFIGQYPY